MSTLVSLFEHHTIHLFYDYRWTCGDHNMPSSGCDWINSSRSYHDNSPSSNVACQVCCRMIKYVTWTFICLEYFTNSCQKSCVMEVWHHIVMCTRLGWIQQCQNQFRFHPGITIPLGMDSKFHWKKRHWKRVTYHEDTRRVFNCSLQSPRHLIPLQRRMNCFLT